MVEDDEELVAPRTWGAPDSELDLALNDLERKQAIARRQTTYEITLVRTLCRKWPTEMNFTGLTREVASRTGGRGEVSLSLFLECNPSFPLRLGADKLWQVDRTSPVDWFERPTKTRPHRAWFDWYAELASAGGDADRPTALAFPWHKLTSFMVIHDLGASWDAPGRRMAYTAPHPAAAAAVFVIEPLDQLLEFLHPEPHRARDRRRPRVRTRRARDRDDSGDGPEPASA